MQSAVFVWFRVHGVLRGWKLHSAMLAWRRVQLLLQRWRLPATMLGESIVRCELCEWVFVRPRHRSEQRGRLLVDQPQLFHQKAVGVGVALNILLDEIGAAMPGVLFDTKKNRMLTLCMMLNLGHELPCV